MTAEEESKVEIIIPHVEFAGEPRILNTQNLPHQYINNPEEAIPAGQTTIDVKETEPGSGVYK